MKPIKKEDNELPQAHKDILDERLKYHQEHPNEGKSWKEVKDGLRRFQN